MVKFTINEELCKGLRAVRSRLPEEAAAALQDQAERQRLPSREITDVSACIGLRVLRPARVPMW